ncbi:MAG: CHAP domain-containing protein [Clostridia bacterium]|nr:CHAP domain-containing protein [Clostridia bacterium]
MRKNDGALVKPNPALRLTALLMALFMLPCSFAFSEANDGEDAFYYPDITLEMRPESVYETGETPLYWTSDAPETAVGEGSAIHARGEGFAVVTAVFPDGLEIPYDVEVSEDAVPPLIRASIDLALSEWENALGKTFTQRNKYTAWYCGTGPKCYFGWCGGFVSYCLDTAGVPMDDYNASVPHENGEPYAVRAAGVGKILTGYTKMDRLSTEPRPGYLIIYGKRDYYNTMHVGMVTEVKPLGDGQYIVWTVEGNLSSRIKRYCYLYDANDTTKHNYKAPPEEWQTDKKTFTYGTHQKDWFVYAICATWE